MPRLKGFDYRSPFFYMVTLKRLPGLAPFSEISAEAAPERNARGAPKYLLPNALTLAFSEPIRRFSEQWRGLEPIRHFIVMPDHIHLLLKIAETEDRLPLGSYVHGLMRALARAYWAAAPALPAPGQGPAHNTPINAGFVPGALSPGVSGATGALSPGVSGATGADAPGIAPVFARDWHEWIVKKRGQLEAFKRYIRENPERAWLRKRNSRYFGTVRKVAFLGREWFAYGNTAILDLPVLVPVKGHRATQPGGAEWNALVEECSRIGPGGVGVGTFMSPLEKACGNAIAGAGGKWVVLAPEGFHERWHPPREKERFCAEGRMLFLSLWGPMDRLPTNSELYRRCHEMGDLAEAGLAAPGNAPGRRPENAPGQGPAHNTPINAGSVPGAPSPGDNAGFVPVVPSPGDNAGFVPGALSPGDNAGFVPGALSPGDNAGFVPGALSPGDNAGFVPGALSPGVSGATGADAPGPYGVCAHMTKDAGFAVHEEECRWIAAAGIGRARIDFPWWMCQPVKDGAVDFSRFDAVVEAAERVGVTPLPIIWSHVDWAHPEGGFIWSATPPERLAAWGRLVEAIVAHYGDCIPEYEIWNEQNIAHFWPNPNPTNYLAVLRTAHEAARRANPRVRILFGGTAGVPLGFIEEIYRLGGADAFEAMNIHPYTHPKPPEGDFEERIVSLRALMAKYGDGDKPIVITEHGWPTHDARAAAESGIKLHGAAKEPYAADETDQARYLVRSVALAMAEGIEAYYWFELRGVESDPAYSEQHFGLMHSNLTPKPAYGAYANFTKMRPAGSVQSPATWKDPARGLYFPQWTRPDGTMAGVIWTVGDPCKLELRFDSDGIRFRDYTGKILVPARISPGVYAVPVSGAPVFFEGGALCR